MEAFRKEEKKFCLETAAAGPGEKMLRFVGGEQPCILVNRRSRYDSFRYRIPGIVFNDAKCAAGLQHTECFCSECLPALERNVVVNAHSGDEVTNVVIKRQPVHRRLMPNLQVFTGVQHSL